MIKFLVAMYLIGRIGSCVSLVSLVWLGVDFLFVLTTVKEFTKTEVADYLEGITDIICSLPQFLIDLIPRYQKEKQEWAQRKMNRKEKSSH